MHLRNLLLSLFAGLCVAAHSANANSFTSTSLVADCESYTLNVNGILRAFEDGFLVEYTIYLDNGQGVTQASGSFAAPNDFGQFHITVTEQWASPLSGTVNVSGVATLYREVNGQLILQETVNLTVNTPVLECVVVPPPGGEGCTPGYWKQRHHFDSWNGYSPNQLFSSVFEDAFPGLTLVEVLDLGGGGLNALGRHTVAALLNGASSGVNYDLATAQVIGAFNAVYPGTKPDYTSLKNRFAGFNEQGCPLN